MDTNKGYWHIVLCSTLALFVNAMWGPMCFLLSHILWYTVPRGVYVRWCDALVKVFGIVEDYIEKGKGDLSC